MSVSQLKRFNTLLDKLLDNSINPRELSEYQKLCNNLLSGLNTIAS